MTRSNWRSVVSRTEVRVSMPALLIIASRRPNAATVWSTSALDVRDAGDVTLDDLGTPAGRLDGRQRGLRRRLVLVIVDGHRGTLGGQLEHDGVTDAAVTAGDDGDLVLEQHACVLLARDDGRSAGRWRPGWDGRVDGLEETSGGREPGHGPLRRTAHASPGHQCCRHSSGRLLGGRGRRGRVGGGLVIRPRILVPVDTRGVASDRGPGRCGTWRSSPTTSPRRHRCGSGTRT